MEELYWFSNLAARGNLLGALKSTDAWVSICSLYSNLIVSIMLFIDHFFPVMVQSRIAYISFSVSLVSFKRFPSLSLLS